MSYKGFKKRTLREEQAMLKKQRAELIEVKQKLKIETSRIVPDKTKIENFKLLCETLQSDYARLLKPKTIFICFSSLA